MFVYLPINSYGTEVRIIPKNYVKTVAAAALWHQQVTQQLQYWLWWLNIPFDDNTTTTPTPHPPPPPKKKKKSGNLMWLWKYNIFCYISLKQFSIQGVNYVFIH